MDQLAHRAAERRVRMVHEHVTGPQHLEEVGPALVARQFRLGDAAPVRPPEFGPPQVGDLVQSAQIDRTPDAVDRAGGQLELPQQQFEQLLRHRVGHLEADRPLEAAAAQLHLHRDQQVLGVLVVEGEVGVAGDPEGVVLQQLHAREEHVEMGGDDVLEGDEPVGPLGGGNPPGEGVGDLHPGEATLGVDGVAHQHGQVQRQVRDEREGVAGVDGQRGEHREDPLLEVLAEMVALPRFEVGDREQVDALGRQLGLNLLEEQALLLAAQLRGDLADLAELLGRGVPVEGALGELGGHPVGEARHADLEELVEVGGEDAQVPGPLQQRHLRVTGEAQNPGVECEPGQFPAEVVSEGLTPSADARSGRHGVT